MHESEPSKSAAYSLNSKSTQVPHCSSAPLPILQPKDSYCYLGVWVNPKGDSDFHIKQLLHKTKERLLKIQKVPATGVRKCQVINAMVLPLWTYAADAYYAPRTLLAHVRSLCLTVIKSAFHLMRSASTDALVSPWKQGGQNLWDVCDLYKAFTITAYFYYLNTPSSIAYQVVLSRLDHYQVKKHLSISPLSDVSSAHSLPSDTIGRVRRFMNELGVRFSLSIPPVQDPASTGIPVFRSFPKDTTVIQARTCLWISHLTFTSSWLLEA